jgi:hypothetical protein
MNRRFRTGASWGSKDPDLSPLVTIAEYDPAEEPDEQGRRASDVLIGCAPRALAEEIVAAVNERPWLAGPVKRAFLEAAKTPPRVRFFEEDS